MVGHAREAVFAAMILLFAWAASASLADDTLRFTQDAFEDFVDGKIESAGQNMYIHRGGTVRTINRFDLNEDGYLDLLFNCTHDTHQMLPATVGVVDEQREAKGVSLPVEGSQKVVLGDLNRDGHLEAVFCPNAIGVHHDRRFVMIAWGGLDGWTSRRISTPLPINAAADVDLADVNGDGWLDIAALGGPRWRPDQPPGRIVRIYWGGEHGFSATELQDFGIEGAFDLSSADFDADGFRDLAALCSTGAIVVLWAAPNEKRSADPLLQTLELPDRSATCLTAADVDGDRRPDLVCGTTESKVFVVRNDAQGRWKAAEGRPAFAATDVAVADLDADVAPDLVLTQFSEGRAAGGEQAGAVPGTVVPIRILWGAATNSKSGTSELHVPAARATAVGDMDGDGIPDLVVAVHQGETTFQGESLVFFGDGRRGFQRGATGFKTAGTTDVAVAPAEPGRAARTVFCNSIGGRLDESVPLHLFWGASGGFDPERVWKIPFHSGYESSAADLDADGFVDLVLLNSGHAGDSAHVDPTLGANILWGGPGGLEHSTRRTVLHEHFLGTSSVADLNRDGYLDLVLEPFAPEEPNTPDLLIIYYGGPKGFEKSRRVAFPAEGYSQEHLVADLNGDDWLDITVSTRKFHCARIFWGGPDGFHPENETRLKVAGPLGVDAADFNADGRLDLLIGSYDDPVSGHRDMGLVIFWGSGRGFDHANSQWLPGFSPLGRTIADFDSDGWLDIFSPQHSGELTREDLACHIYWGSAEGFATRGRTTLICDSVNDSLAGDFDGDGLIDLAVSCHTRHGDHRAESRVFYNDGRRFANPRIQKLPTNGPHLMWATDLGHIADRKFRERYISPVFRWDRACTGGKLQFQAQVPAGTRLDFEVRAADRESHLAEQAWVKLDGIRLPLRNTDRCLQYRAVFQSTNGDRYPLLDRVDVVLE